MRRDDGLWTQTLAPELAFRGGLARWLMSAGARGTFEVGTPVNGGGVAGTLRHGAAGEAHAGLTYGGPGGSSASAAGFAQRSRDLLDVDRATVDAAGDVTRWGASASLAEGVLEGAAQMHGWVQNERLTSARSLEWTGRAMGWRGEATTLYAAVRERRLEQDRASVLLADAALLGVRRQLGDALTAALELGGGNVVTKRDGGPGPAAAVELAMPATADGRGEFRGRYARTVGDDEWEGLVGRRMGSGRVWASGGSLVDIEASGRGPAMVDRAALGAADTLGGDTELGFEGSVARVRPFRGTPVVQTRALRVSAWIARRVQPWLTARAGGVLLRQQGAGEEPGPSYRRSRVEVSLSAHAR